MACGTSAKWRAVWCVETDVKPQLTHSLTQSTSQSLSVVSNLTQTGHQARTAVADAATRTHQVTRADNSSSTTSSVTSSRRGTDNHDVIVVRRARRSAKPRSDCVRVCRCSVNATWTRPRLSTISKTNGDELVMTHHADSEPTRLAATVLPLDARYASAVYAVVIIMSVCPSQAGIVSKLLDELSWYLAYRLPSINPTLSYKHIWVSPKIRVLPCVNLPQTLEFRRGKSIALSTKLVVDGRACWRHL